MSTSCRFLRSKGGHDACTVELCRASCCSFHRTAYRPHRASAFLVVVAVSACLLDFTTGQETRTCINTEGLERGLEWNVDAPIVFGQSAVYSGPNKDLGILMRRGILAAFNEYNDVLDWQQSRGLRNATGFHLGLISYDDGYNGVPARENTIRLIEVDKVHAIVGEVGTPTSAEAAPAARTRSVPFIGAFTGAAFLREPFHPMYINYRASYIDESAAMVRYFAGVRQLTRISVFRQNDSFGMAVRVGVVKALRARRLMIHSEGLYQKNTVEVTQGLEAMASQTDHPPDAIVMVGTYSALSKFVKEAKAKPGWSNCYFSTVSFVGPASLSRQLENAANREKVLITQTVPFPENTSIALVRQYQQAMQRWETKTGECGTPDFTSFEGYIVGNMVARLSAEVPAYASVTDFRQRLSQVLYNDGILNLEDFRLGPYGGFCNQNGTGCHCNQGQRQVYGTKIEDDGNFSEFADLDFSFQTCGFQESSDYDVEFGQSAALSGVASGLGLGMQLGIQAAFHEATGGSGDSQADAALLSFYQPKLKSLDDVYAPVNAVGNTRQLMDVDHVFGLIGYVGTPTVAAVTNYLTPEAGVPFIGPFTGAGFLRSDKWKSTVVNIRASYTDECVAMVHYYTQVKNFEKISIFGQNDGYGMAGEIGLDIALKAYGLEITSIGRYEPMYNCPECNSVLLNCPCSNGTIVQAVDEMSAAQPQAIVIFATGSHTVEFIKQMLRRPGACDGPCHFAAVSFVGSAYLLEHLNTPELRANVIITQVVPLYTDTSESLVSNYQHAVDNYVASPDYIASSTGSAPEYGFVSLEGYMVGRLIVRVLSRLAVVSRKHFIDKLYETRIIQLVDEPANTAGQNHSGSTFSLGPYERKLNNTVGCNQGMRKVYLTRIGEGPAFEYVAECPRYEYSQCGLTADNIECYSGKYRNPVTRVMTEYRQFYRELRDEKCSPCPAGSSTDGRVCTPCQVGTHWQDGDCLDCPPGTFSNEVGQSESCSICPPGKYEATHRSSQCKDCAPGRWREASAGQAERCDACAKGKYRSPGSMESCAFCDHGTFADTEASTVCRSCETIMMNSITTLVGADSHKDCLCPAGSYGTRVGAEPIARGQCVSCGSNLGEEFGLNCPGGRTENGSSIAGLTGPTVLEGYMIFPPVDNEFDLPVHLNVYRCWTTEKVCQQTYQIWNLSQMCKRRRIGVACGMCPAGYYRMIQGCDACQGTFGVTLFIIFVLFPFGAWLLYVFLNHLSHFPSKNRYEAFADDTPTPTISSRTHNMVHIKTADWLTKAHKSRSGARKIFYTAQAFRLEMYNVSGNILKIILAYVQTLGVVMPLFPPLPFETDLHPPDLRVVLQNVGRFLSVQLSFINRFLRFDCLVGSDFKRLYLLELCGPFYIGCIFTFNFGVYKLCVRPIQLRLRVFLQDRYLESCWEKFAYKACRMQITWVLTFNLLGNLMTTLYISVTYLTMALMVPYDHPGADMADHAGGHVQGATGKSVQRFPGVLQESPEWWVMMPVAWCFFVLYCLGMLALSIWACYRAPKAMITDTEFMIKWNFLIGDFHPSVWWWEVILLLRGLIWNLAVILSPTEQIACVGLIIIFALYLGFNYAWRPWGGDYSTLKNVCDTSCNMMICIIVPAMSLRAEYSQAIVDRSRKIIEWAESIAVMMPIACTVGCMIFPMHQFVYRKRNAVSVFTTSQQLKALVLLITRASNTAINKFWANLNDTDHQTMIRAMHVFYAEMLQMQPGDRLTVQRLIPQAEEFKVKDDATILRLIESSVNNGKDDLAGLHERALVQWVLEQLLAGYTNLERWKERTNRRSSRSSWGASSRFAGVTTSTSSSNNGSSNGPSNAPGAQLGNLSPANTQGLSNLQSSRSSKETRDLETQEDAGVCCCAPKEIPGRRKKKVRVSGLFKEMDQDADGILTLEEFREQGRRLAPLCEAEELDDCFHLLDGEGIGFFNEDRFVLIFKGLTYRTNSSKHSADQLKYNTLTRNALLRLSMKARGGEQTMERFARTSRVRRLLMGFQRRLKVRFAEKQKRQYQKIDSLESNVQPALLGAPVTNEIPSQSQSGRLAREPHSGFLIRDESDYAVATKASKDVIVTSDESGTSADEIIWESPDIQVCAI